MSIDIPTTNSLVTLYTYQQWNGNSWGGTVTSPRYFDCDGFKANLYSNFEKCPHKAKAIYTMSMIYFCDSCARREYLMSSAFKPTEAQIREALTKLAHSCLEVRRGAETYGTATILSNLRSYTEHNLELMSLLVGFTVGK